MNLPQTGPALSFANGPRHSSRELELRDIEFAESMREREVTATKLPVPGQLYDIQYGKGGLLTTAERAYGKAERLKRAQGINGHPLNRKFWKSPGNAFERQYFPQGIIDFNPSFTCDKNQRRATKGEKRCFAKIWIPPREDDTCGVPQRTILEEIFLEGEIEDFQVARQAVPVRPRLCLFQNHSRHRNHFHRGALEQARRIGAISSPDPRACRRRVGPTPYDTGADIIRAIEATFECFGDRPVQEVHVFSHASTSGVHGTTFGQAGLYQDSVSAIDRRDGGRAVSDIPTGMLANNVTFILHGCNLGAGTDNFARSLYEHLAASLDRPRVFGHHNGGCAGRNNSWREYSNRHPRGRNIAALANIASTVACDR